MRVKKSDQVLDSMKKRILEGQWGVGEKIPSENKLAEVFGVSRVTIRHAIQQLETIGLIRTVFGDGSYVCEAKPADMINLSMIPLSYFSAKQVPEVFGFRRAIEVETTGMAVELATKKDIDYLKKIAKQMEKKLNDGNGFVEEDLDFHLYIAKITGNALIIGVETLLKDILSVTMQEIFDKTRGGGDYKNGLESHWELIRAFEKKDISYAKDVMREHLTESVERYEKYL